MTIKQIENFDNERANGGRTVRHFSGTRFKKLTPKMKERKQLAVMAFWGNQEKYLWFGKPAPRQETPTSFMGTYEWRKHGSLVNEKREPRFV